MADLEEYPCGVCCEMFNCDDTIPRLLPCTHSICERCLEKLVKTDRQIQYVICPECRKKHVAPSGAKSFPENRYILDHLRAKLKASTNEPATCTKHGQATDHHCQTCSSNICAICVILGHLQHTVVLVREQKKKELYSRINEILGKFVERVDKLDEIKEEVDKTYKDNIKTFNGLKERILDQLEVYESELLNQKSAFHHQVDDRTKKLDENIDLLLKMRGTQDVSTVAEVDEMSRKAESICENLEEYEEISYKYHKYGDGVIENNDRYLCLIGTSIEQRVSTKDSLRPPPAVNFTMSKESCKLSTIYCTQLWL